MAQEVDFGSVKLMGVLGVLSGTAIAIGVPWIVLNSPQVAELGGFAVTLLALVGIVGGVALAAIAAFFALVIPSKVADERRSKSS